MSRDPTEPALNQVSTPPRQPEETLHPRRSTLAGGTAGAPTPPSHHHKGMDGGVETAARQGDEPNASLYDSAVTGRDGSGVYWFAAIMLLLAIIILALAIWGMLTFAQA